MLGAGNPRPRVLLHALRGRRGKRQGQGERQRHRPCRRQTVGLYVYGFSGFTPYFMTLILTFSGSGRARGTGTSRGTGSGSDRTGGGRGRAGAGGGAGARGGVGGGGGGGWGGG